MTALRATPAACRLGRRERIDRAHPPRHLDLVVGARAAPPLLDSEQDERCAERELEHAHPRGGIAIVTGVCGVGDRKHDRTEDEDAREPAGRERRPVERARTLPSKSTTTMTGTGLTAMATASGSIWPIASPIRD